MSDSLPENSFSGALRVVRLTTGEEIIGIVDEADQHKINIKLPAKLENYLSKDDSGSLVEYVKLTNYLVNLKNFEANIPRSSIIYIGQAASELIKMYEIFFVTIQTDPKSIPTSNQINNTNNQSGLELLNSLFNNDDFVNFVNDLIENFEGVEILMDDDGDEGLYEENDVIDDPVIPEPPSPPKRKKRNTMKPEKKSLPYNPEADPKDASSWPDDPGEYI